MTSGPIHVTDFTTLASLIRAQLRADTPIIVGVSGLSGAGKTTLCRALLSEFPNRLVHLSCDDFSARSYTDRMNRIEAAVSEGDLQAIAAEENPQHWYGWDDIKWAIDRLRKDGCLTFDRAWNRKTGELNALLSINLPGRGNVAVLCDGIFLLHEPIRQLFDISLLVETPMPRIIARGRKRAARNGSPGDALRMERLTETYSLPYFRRHSSQADWVFNSAAF